MANFIEFTKLEGLVDAVKGDKNFDENSARVFVNMNDDLAVICLVKEKGYIGYFLNLETGEITYSE
jgi:hypothetical protein